MDASDVISGIAAVISSIALLVSYIAVRRVQQGRINDKLQDLRIIISDLLNEINIIEVKYRYLDIDHESHEVKK